MSNGNKLEIDDVIGGLQADLVKALLGMNGLPGYDQPFPVPDLSSVVVRDVVLVLDDNLRGNADEELLGIARIVSREELHTIGVEAAGLSFDEPEVRGAVISLRLRIVLARRGRPLTTEGGLLVRFVEDAGRWTVEEEPVVL